MANCKPDFLAWDFNSNDFFASLARMSFMQFLFPLLPVYFKKYDSYKDKYDRGFLERFLVAHGWEIDQEIIPFIECYLDIIDAKQAPEKYLDHLSDVLGNPPDITQDDAYRNILRYAVTIYKIKGTRKSFELFFSLLGFDVEIYEVPWNNEDIKYDSGHRYDTGLPTTYDLGGCQHCSYYDLIFYTTNSSNYILSPEMIERVRRIIGFLEPIDTKLRNFEFGIKLEDTIDIEITEEVNVIPEVLPRMYYDKEELYDDEHIYDEASEALDFIGMSIMKLGVSKQDNNFTLNAQIDYVGPNGLNTDISVFKLSFIKQGITTYYKQGLLIQPIDALTRVSGKLIDNQIWIPIGYPQDYDYLLLEGQLIDNYGNVAKFKQRLRLGTQNVELYYYNYD